MKILSRRRISGLNHVGDGTCALWTSWDKMSRLHGGDLGRRLRDRTNSTRLHGSASPMNCVSAKREIGIALIHNRNSLSFLLDLLLLQSSNHLTGGSSSQGASNLLLKYSGPSNVYIRSRTRGEIEEFGLGSATPPPQQSHSRPPTSSQVYPSSSRYPLIANRRQSLVWINRYIASSSTVSSAASCFSNR
jgi:hypothetical protein